MKRSPVTTFLITLSLGSLLAGCMDSGSQPTTQTEEIARPAKIFTVIPSTHNALRSFPGTLEASQKAELAFRVGGQLETLPAQSGLRVKQGELLAGIDETEYLNTYRAQQARYELAKIQHDQAKVLLKKKLSSQLQFDQAAAELKSAKAARDQAQENLLHTKLIAPFDGVVGRVSVDNFQAIQAKKTIIQLQDDTHLDVHFSVPESLISRLKRIEDPKIIESICGEVRFSSRPDKRFKACHKEHESVPDSLTRNYAAVFSLPPVEDFAALPGMTVSIEIDFTPFMPEANTASLLIPSQAVFDKQDKQWVWKVDDQFRARQTPVQVIKFKDDYLEIKGLRQGDQIITAGVSYVRENMLVKPITKERGL